jgi:anhydro-N-acetylmuramic acid kinase
LCNLHPQKTNSAQMVYNVIGLMSGSSLDGLDIAYVQLTEISGKWEYDIQYTQCEAYPEDLKAQLATAAQLPVPRYLKLHTDFGHYIGNQVNEFIAKNQLQHKVHFIASHGHTTWHEPQARTTAQIGDGAAIAAITLLPVITDLRNTDVALGGQGAPIVPIADQLLFSNYDFCLNIGGIANVTINNNTPIAFDICTANQILNHYAALLGLPYDDKGLEAQKGNVNEEVLAALNALPYYQQPTPKSLHNGYLQEAILPLIAGLHANDALATTVQHIAIMIAKALAPYLNPLVQQSLLVTGGGAFNDYLLTQIAEQLQPNGNVQISTIDTTTIAYKEALAMALMGALRWREETNVLQSVTGASSSNIGGAMWLPPLD